MKDENKTKRQLMDELVELHRRIAELEVSEAKLKRTKEALRETEKRYRTLLDNSLAGIYIREGERLRFVNKSLSRLLGYTRKELLGMRFLDLVYPDDRAAAQERAERLTTRKHSAEPYQCRAVTKSGDVLWIEVYGTRINYQGKPAILGNFIDITELKRTEEELKGSEASLKKAQELARVGSWKWDLVTNFFELSDEARRIYDITDSRDFFTYQFLVDTVIHPDDRDTVRKTAAAILGGHPPEQMTYRIVRPDREVRWVALMPPEVQSVSEDG
ncbi:MAG: PAS domain S-box protein, partial [Candidatus Hydrogenedentota bacterium]